MDRKPVRVDAFSGINNVADADEARKGEFQTIVNMEVTDSGSLVTRAGREQLFNPGYPDGLFCYKDVVIFRSDSSLRAIQYDPDTGDPSMVYVNNTAGLSNKGRMAYLGLNDDIYWSDTENTGVIYGNPRGGSGAGVPIYNRTWGLDVPPPPGLTSTIGELPAGDYQVTLTYLRNDGQESGAALASKITLANKGGILISNIPQSSDSTVDKINVYVSPTSGEVLYRVMILTNGVGTATYATTGKDLGQPLMTQHMTPPPAGHLLCYYNGRIYIADGNVLWYTEPFKYELIRLDHNFIVFPDRITMLRSVKNGLWLSAGDDTSFYAGTGPEPGFDKTKKASYGAIEGTAVDIDGQLVRAQGVIPGQAVMWTSQRGVCLGSQDGYFVNLTDGRYEFPSATHGVAMLREDNDNTQYMVGLYYSRLITLPGYSVSGTGTTT